MEETINPMLLDMLIFNALNTYEVGAYYAELFSDAHESDVPNPLLLEKQMDLFNKAVGHDAVINYPNLNNAALADQIYQEVLSGNLKYLSSQLAVITII